MSNIIKASDINFPEKASQEHKAVVVAAKQPPLKTLQIEEVGAKITELFLRAKAISGQVNSDPVVMKEAVKLLTKRILDGKYGNLTLAQLETAIEKGALGEYGEFMGINTTTINIWIRKYYDYQVRFMKIQLQHEAAINFERQKAEEREYFKKNAEKLMLQRFEREYNTLKKNSNYLIFDPNSAFYDYLVVHEILPVPHPNREKFIKLAESQQKEDWRNELTMARGVMRTRIKGWIDNITETLEQKPVARSKFQTKVKLLILMDYCKNHIEIESEFEDVVAK